MLFIYGTRLLGKVDVVPGMFHVATKFAHLNFVPLIPMGSWIVLEQSGKGVKIAPSAKSIFMGWGRAILLIVALGASLAGLVSFDAPEWPFYVGFALAAWIVWGLIMWHKLFTHAKFERAYCLAQKAGFSEAGLREIQRIYDEMRIPAGARAFEVIDRSPAPAIPVSAAQPVVPAAAVTSTSMAKPDEQEPVRAPQVPTLGL